MKGTHTRENKTKFTPQEKNKRLQSDYSDKARLWKARLQQKKSLQRRKAQRLWNKRLNWEKKTTNRKSLQQRKAIGYETGYTMKIIKQKIAPMEESKRLWNKAILYNSQTENHSYGRKTRQTKPVRLSCAIKLLTKKSLFKRQKKYRIQHSNEAWTGWGLWRRAGVHKGTRHSGTRQRL